MKRLLATLAGFGAGLVLTLLSLVVMSHANLPHSDSGAGCGDIEHCGASWGLGSALVLIYLGPSIAFAAAGYLAAARSWTARRIAGVFGALAAGTVLAAMASYMV